jgi:nitroreductase
MTKSVEESAFNRSSIRKYTDAPIPQTDLRRILEIAHRAPTVFNIQPTRFVVVQSPELKLELQAAAFGQPQVGSAPVVIVVVSDFENALETLPEIVHPGFDAAGKEGLISNIQRNYGAQSVEQRGHLGNAQSNIVIGYLLLAIESLGYGSSPMLGFNPQAVKTLLELPETSQIAALISLGVPAESGRPQHRHDLERISTWR